MPTEPSSVSAHTKRSRPRGAASGDDDEAAQRADRRRRRHGRSARESSGGEDSACIGCATGEQQQAPATAKVARHRKIGSGSKASGARGGREWPSHNE